MTKVNFLINFTKSNESSQKIHLKSGLHILYGDSGVGKTNLCRFLTSRKVREYPENFTLSEISGFDSKIMVGQNPDSQIVSSSVERELAFNFENLGWESNRIKGEMDKLIKRFNFSFRMTQHPETLSGGERQILNISTAISVFPQFLLIDDGLGFLSLETKLKCLKILQIWLKETDSVILWVTSDETDLNLSENRWILNHFELTKVVGYCPKPKYSVSNYPEGKLKLIIRDLNFYFSKKSPIFSNISCQIGPFRSLGIIGDNGSGKSTFAALISGILTPVSGFIDCDLNGYKPKIGLIPQFPERIFGGYTPQELTNLFIFEKLCGKNFLNDVISSLEKFQIIWGEISKNLFNQLSLSEARIVIIYLLSHCKYDVLIFDEPMFSLGTSHRSKMIEFFTKIIKDKYLILISHNDEEVSSICDNTVKIQKKEFVIH